MHLSHAAITPLPSGGRLKVSSRDVALSIAAARVIVGADVKSFNLHSNMSVRNMSVRRAFSERSQSSRRP